MFLLCYLTNLSFLFYSLVLLWATSQRHLSLPPQTACSRSNVTLAPRHSAGPTRPLSVNVPLSVPAWPVSRQKTVMSVNLSFTSFVLILSQMICVLPTIFPSTHELVILLCAITCSLHQQPPLSMRFVWIFHFLKWNPQWSNDFETYTYILFTNVLGALKFYWLP